MFAICEGLSLVCSTWEWAERTLPLCFFVPNLATFPARVRTLLVVLVRRSLFLFLLPQSSRLIPGLHDDDVALDCLSPFSLKTIPSDMAALNNSTLNYSVNCCCQSLSAPKDVRRTPTLCVRSSELSTSSLAEQLPFLLHPHNPFFSFFLRLGPV